MPAGSFFHSPELFHIIEKTPGHRPFMAVVTGPDGKVAAHMMAVFRRTRWALFGKAQIYGEGDYESDEPSAPLFGMMLETLTHCFRSRLCLVAEISGLSRKMFAYRQFRQCGYFPIRWQEVSNSLHSVPPGERLTAKTLRNIRQGKAMGVTCREARSREEVRAFHRLLARYYRTKWRRYIPSEAVIAALWDNAHIRIFLTFIRSGSSEAAFAPMTGAMPGWRSWPRAVRPTAVSTPTPSPSGMPSIGHGGTTMPTSSSPTWDYPIMAIPCDGSSSASEGSRWRATAGSASSSHGSADSSDGSTASRPAGTHSGHVPDSPETMSSYPGGGCMRPV